MSGGRHQILRQVLELELASAARAPQVHDEVARLFRERALADLEVVFERALAGDEVLRLERLELDLGELRGPHWREDFLRRLRDQLGEALARAVAERPESRAEASGDELGSDASQRERQLLFFLARGHLPWWGGKPEGSWEDALPDARASARSPALAELLRTDTRARRRLIQSVGDRFLATVVEAAGAPARADELLALLTSAERARVPRASERERFWVRVLALALDAAPSPARARILLQSWLERAPAPRAASATHASRERDAADLPERAQSERPARLPEPWRSWLSTSAREAPAHALPTPEEKVATTDARLAEPASGVLRAFDADAGRALDPARRAADAVPADELEPALQPHARSAQRRPELREREALYLEGAGVVIVHPFIEELFRGVGLLEGREFRDAEARCRGVALLAQLTFGRSDVPEHDLLLPKLLCDLAWEENAPACELEDAEREACDALLGAVLRHWTALRSASPDWLRAQFFLREGKLERVDSGWKLGVERRAQDVLLDRLPWGLGLIRLPWLPTLLHVDWAA